VLVNGGKKKDLIFAWSGVPFFYSRRMVSAWIDKIVRKNVTPELP